MGSTECCIVARLIDYLIGRSDICMCVSSAWSVFAVVIVVSVQHDMWRGFQLQN